MAIGDQFSDGSPVDIWAYGRCERLINPSAVPFEVQVPGDPVDYNCTAFGCTVISDRMARVVEGIAPLGVQFIPATLEAPGKWEVLNILDCLDCIDRERSLIQYFPEDHPEKAGRPRGVAKLIIDPDAIGDHHMFRLRDWMVVEIVSEAMKGELERNGIGGMEYWPVTP
ncbi:imm11 family protein [Singulisphaera sp. PoT]|uniref:imm11 family protein n=1 Tax=Singulisphaera sp. PoT TaxID=3411797 RepID=UPI003BF51C2D